MPSSPSGAVVLGAAAFLAIVVVSSRRLGQRNQRHVFASSLLVSALFLLRYLVIRVRRRKMNLPTGPVGLPLIGHLPAVLCDPVNWARDLAVAYGGTPANYFFLGSTGVLLMNEPGLVRQVMSHPKILDRPPIVSETMLDTVAFMGATKDWWHRRRVFKAILVKLFTSTFSTNMMKGLHCRLLFPKLSELAAKGELWFPRRTVSFLSLSALYAAMFGDRLDDNDPKFAEWCESADHWFDAFDQMQAVVLIPSLKPFMRNTVANFQEAERVGLGVVREWVRRWQERQKTNPQGCMIAEMIALRRKRGMDASLDAISMDVYISFIGGHDTVATCMETGYVVLAKHSAPQEEVFRELAPLVKDRPDLKNADGHYMMDLKLMRRAPKLQALVWELVRLGHTGALLLPHYAREAVTVAYDDPDTGERRDVPIPKDTLCLTNMFFIHETDTRHWRGRPSEINLDNWLVRDPESQMDGVRFVRNHNVVYFGYGKRDCLGRHLAMQQLYMLTASLVLNYRLSLDDPSVPMTYKPAVTTHLLPEVGVRMERRVPL